MKARINYGNVHVGQFYTLITEGVDFFLVRVRGKLLYAPKWVFID